MPEATEAQYAEFARKLGAIYEESDWLEVLGLLSSFAHDSEEGKLRSTAGLCSIVDELVQPYSQLTDCALDECGEPGHCRMCLACGEDLQPWKHKVIWSGPEGWPVCDKKCGERYAAAFFLAWDKAMVY